MYRNIFLGSLLLIVVIGIVISQSEVTAPTRTPAITEESAATASQGPTDWQTYKDNSLGFSISYPPAFEVTQNGYHSIMLIKKVTEPGQGPANFIYISTILKEDENKEGEIYNYNKTHIDSLIQLQVNEEKPVAGEAAELEQYVTFKRLTDTTIDGQKAMLFVNMKPWEFPLGTKEYRNLVQQKDRSYWIGGYIATTRNDDDSISEALYQQILSSITLPAPN